MKVVSTALPGVLVIEPAVFADERGFFLESWSACAFAQAGIDTAFVQDNHSRSARGVLRGIHYQIGKPQGKLVRVSAGSAFDVAVDLRLSSPTYAQWFGIELSGENRRMLWIPPGFGHAFLSLADDTDLLYKCSECYSPEGERCISWDDPDVAIDWPLPTARPILSVRDSKSTALRNAEVFA